MLPFESLSDDKADAYFARGIQDEIPTRLSRVGALRVISRNFTASLDSKPGDLPGIARRLGVAHLLEGSVQKIEALAGEHEAALKRLESLTATADALNTGDLRYSPIWDSVCDDPRFQKVLTASSLPLAGN